MKRRGFLLGFHGLILCGCEPRKPPSDARRKGFPRLVERPEDLLPSGLDVVLRLDPGRLRGAAASSALAPWQEPLQRRLGGGEQASLLELLRVKAELIWVGLRGIPVAGHWDAVLVAQGNFLSFNPSSQGSSWERLPTVHPGRTVYERKGEVLRGVPSLLALVENRLLVLATPLEAPAVLRLLENGPASVGLTPPADGFLGLVAKPAVLARAAQGTYPHLASLLRALSTLEGVMEFGHGVLRVDLRLSTRTEAEALRVEQVLLGWKDVFSVEENPVANALAVGARVERDGPRSIRGKLCVEGEVIRRLAVALG
ncbi:MAG: hypothetical protein RMJ98_08165 [Myxococcales bacterium]|nr:hypothetical protein [Polyangiaceae bacterium]MDW8249261.1 hypothetical protein [Myxococcales bacterium]